MRILFLLIVNMTVYAQSSDEYINQAENLLFNIASLESGLSDNPGFVDDDESNFIKRPRVVDPRWLEVIKLYNKAASLGSADAYSKLASFYNFGTPGLSPNRKKAKELQLKAIELNEQEAYLGNVKAMENLGMIYSVNSYGILENKEKALEWFTKAQTTGKSNDLTKQIIESGFLDLDARKNQLQAIHQLRRQFGQSQSEQVLAGQPRLTVSLKQVNDLSIVLVKPAHSDWITAGSTESKNFRESQLDVDITPHLQLGNNILMVLLHDKPISKKNRYWSYALEVKLDNRGVFSSRNKKASQSPGLKYWQLFNVVVGQDGITINPTDVNDSLRADFGEIYNNLLLYFNGDNTSSELERGLHLPKLFRD